MNLIGCFAILLCASSQAADWKQFQSDPTKTGINISEKLSFVTGKYGINFQSFGGDTVFNLASAIVAGDTVYIGTTEGSIGALSRKSGAESWRRRVDGPVTNAPAYLDGLLVVATQSGVLYCLDASDGGRELWRYYLGTSVIASPSVATVDDGRHIFISGLDGSVSCLGITDGNLIWRMTTSGPIHGSPTLSEDGNRVYVASDDMRLYALNSKTGALLWKSNPQSLPIGQIRASVAVRGNRLYVASLNHGLFCVADQNYSPLLQWRVDFTGSHTGSPAVVLPNTIFNRITVFVANDAGQVFAIGDGGNAGIEDWHRDVSPGSRIVGSLAYADGQVFVCSEDKKLHILNAKDGIKETVFSVTEALDSSPAIARGDIIVADASGRLYAFGNPLDPPRNLSAMVDGNQRVILSWSPEYMKPLGVTPVSGYTIYRSLQPDGEFAPIGYVEGQQIIRDEGGNVIATPTTSVYTDSSVTASGFYYYSVTAMNEETGAPPIEESTYSEVAVAAVNLPPVPPRVTVLTAIAGDGIIHLKWAVESGDSRISRIWLFRSEGSGASLALSRTLTAEDTSFEDIRVENSIGYGYALVAVNMKGIIGPQSAVVAATPYTIGWPMFQRNAIHEGSDEAVDIAPPLGVHWSVTLTRELWRQVPSGMEPIPSPGGIGYTEWQTPVVVGGTVFVTSLGGDVRAYCENTSDLLWAKSGYWGFYSTPVYYDGRLYLFHEFGLTALDPVNGDVAWEMGIAEMGLDPTSHNYLAESPIVYKGVLLNTLGDRLIAIDIETRSVLWSSGSTITLAAARGRVFTALRNGHIQCLDVQTGTVKWEQSWLYDFYSTMNAQMINISVDPYAVLVTHLNGNIYALNYDTGEIMWQSDVLGGFSYISPAEQGSTCYVVTSYNNTVYAMKASDGSLLWSTTTFTLTATGFPMYDEYGHLQLSGATHGGPVVGGKRIYVYTTTGEFFTIDITTGVILDNYGIGQEVLRASKEAGMEYHGYSGFPLPPDLFLAGHMSVGQKHIFVTAPDGRLMAIGPVLAGPPSIIVQAGISQLDLRWDQPDVAISPIAGYRIFRSTSYEETGSAVAEVAGAGATVYTDIDITGGVTYYYRVAAMDERGIQGRMSGYAYDRTWFEPNITALISAPGTGSVGCLNPVFTITVTGTASSGNFKGYTLQVDTGNGLEPVNQSSTQVFNGPLGAITFSQGGSATLLLTVFDAAGVQGSATAIVEVSAKNLTVQVGWPLHGQIIPSSCDIQRMTLTITGVVFGNRFTGYRLELARLSPPTVLSVSEYTDPVYTTGRLGMVTLPDCDSFVIRIIVTDSCGREQTVAVTLDLQSPTAFLASISTFSTRGRLPGEHRRPMDVVVDKEDFVWVVDTLNKRVQKYTATGHFLFEFGKQDTGKADGITFSEPVAAAVDGANRIIILDRLSGLVMRFDDSGRVIDSFGGNGLDPGVFNHPLGLGVDGRDRIWVADTINNRIQTFNSEGRPITIFGVQGDGTGELRHPAGVQPCMSLIPGGMVVVTDTGNDRIQLFREDGSFMLGFGGSGTAAGAFNAPYESVMGVDGSLFTSDTGNNRIEWRVPDGHTLILLPPASVTLFDRPHGLTLDRESSVLYVADTGNDRIVVIRIKHAADTISPRALIAGPVEGSTVSGSVDMIGIAADAYFAEYSLEYGFGKSPEEFLPITMSNAPVWDGLLGNWDIRSLVPGLYSLRLTVLDKSGNTSSTVVEVLVNNQPSTLIVSASAEPSVFIPEQSGVVFTYRLSAPAAVKAMIVANDSNHPLWTSDSIVPGRYGGMAGANTMAWDGRDDQGQWVLPGRYTMIIGASAGTATDKKAIPIVADISLADRRRGLGGAASSGASGPVANVADSSGGAASDSGVSGSSSDGSGSGTGGSSSTGTGTHDNGIGNGKNPKDFDRGSNPGHGKR